MEDGVVVHHPRGCHGQRSSSPCIRAWFGSKREERNCYDLGQCRLMEMILMGVGGHLGCNIGLGIGKVVLYGAVIVWPDVEEDKGLAGGNISVLHATLDHVREELGHGNND